MLEHTGVLLCGAFLWAQISVALDPNYWRNISTLFPLPPFCPSGATAKDHQSTHHDLCKLYAAIGMRPKVLFLVLSRFSASIWLYSERCSVVRLLYRLYLHLHRKRKQCRWLDHGMMNPAGWFQFIQVWYEASFFVQLYSTILDVAGRVSRGQIWRYCIAYAHFSWGRFSYPSAQQQPSSGLRTWPAKATGARNMAQKLNCLSQGKFSFYHMRHKRLFSFKKKDALRETKLSMSKPFVCSKCGLVYHRHGSGCNMETPQSHSSQGSYWPSRLYRAFRKMLT